MALTKLATEFKKIALNPSSYVRAAEMGLGGLAGGTLGALTGEDASLGHGDTHLRNALLGALMGAGGAGALSHGFRGAVGSDIASAAKNRMMEVGRAGNKQIKDTMSQHNITHPEFMNRHGVDYRQNIKNRLEGIKNERDQLMGQVDLSMFGGLGRA
jgi:hypothetical protein